MALTNTLGVSPKSLNKLPEKSREAFYPLCDCKRYSIKAKHVNS